MKKTLCISILLIILFVSSSYIQKNGQLSSYVRLNGLSSVDGKEMSVYYFGSKGCSHCARVKPFIAQIEHKYGLQLHEFEIYDNRENLQLLDDYFDKYHVPLEERGIPAVFILDSYMIGDVDILDSSEDVVLYSLNSSDARTSRFDSGQSVESNLSLLSITVAALADSINPCSMAILLFLMTGLLLLRKRKKALKVGYAFALSVFVANLLFGMGIHAMVMISNFSSIFKFAGSSIAIVTGVLLIKDCFYQGRGRFVMEVPRKLRPTLKRQLGKAFFGRSSSIIGIFLVGFLVTSLEVPCTGGPYFYVLAGMAENATRLQTIPILLYYNAIFIMPLILLSTFLYLGSIHVEKARAWKDRNKQLLNLIRGSIITCLGLLTIPTTNVIQAVATVLNVYRTLFIPIMLVFSIYLASKFITKSRSKGRVVPWLLIMLIVTPLTMSITAENTIFVQAQPTSALDDGVNEWAPIPVEVNVQVDLEYEGDQATISNILSEIEENGWRATVFVTGEFASNHPHVVGNIEDRGHQIAVHGWQSGEDLTILSYEEQLNLINRSFSTVRNAVARSEYVVDFKPQEYRFNNDTLEVLQELGAESISGVFECNEGFCKCWYAQSLGKLTFPYPITTEFMAIPISSVQIGSEDLLLDDGYVFDITDDPADYLSYLLAKYNEQTETKDPLIISVHASITGADNAKLNALVQFLDYVKGSSGKLVLLDNVKHHTAYITDFDATGPSSASVDEEITISVGYQSNLYCPDYRFRIYGRYPGEDWELLDSACFYVYTGGHSFDIQITIPRPPDDETTYTIRVVGRASHSIYGGGSCDPRDPDWPTYDNYEVMDEITISVNTTCLPVPNRPTGDPNDNIDLIFIPDDDYGGDIDLFLQHVNSLIDNNYGTLAPISANLDHFNFWYTQLQGDANTHPHTVPEDLDCNYDVAAIIHVAGLQDWTDHEMTVFSAEGDDSGRSFIHESGHAVWKLADEYEDTLPGCTDYFQRFPYPNIWRSQEECVNDANAEGWDATDCREFCPASNPCCWEFADLRLTLSWWRIDHDPPEVMVDNWNGFGNACRRRIDWVFTQGGGGGGGGGAGELRRSIIVHLNLQQDEMTLLDSRVKNDFAPNYLPESYPFIAKIFSFEEALLGEYGFDDPRQILGEPGYTGPTWLDNVDFNVVLPYFYNGEFVRIYNGTTDELLISADISQFTSGIVNGTVTDNMGLPVSNALVQVSGTIERSTFTDGNGNYGLLGLQPGGYTLSVTPDPYSNLMLTSESVAVSAGQTTTVDFVLQPAGSIAGTVTDVGEVPVTNVHLYLSGYEPPRYHTDEGGKYIIPGLHAETYTINIDAPSYGPWHISVNGALLGMGNSISIDVSLGQTTQVDFSQQPPDEDPPSINVITPAEGQALQDGVTLKAMVSDPSGVDWVTFSIRERNGEYGIIIDPLFESMPTTHTGNDEWQLVFDTTQLPDGYYLFLVNASDSLGNTGNATVSFSIRNWACLELLPASESNKAGRTMPIKFSLRVIAAVDPAQPFVYNEELTIEISKNGDIQQTSTFGTTARDYRINSENEHYITNFRTIRKKPATYVVDIYRKDMLIGSFDFSTVK